MPSLARETNDPRFGVGEEVVELPRSPVDREADVVRVVFEAPRVDRAPRWLPAERWPNEFVIPRGREGGRGGKRANTRGGSRPRRRRADLDMPAGTLSDIFGMGHRSQRRGGGGHCLNLSPRIEVSACSPAFHHEGTRRGTFRVPQGRVDRVRHLRSCPGKVHRFAFSCVARRNSSSSVRLCPKMFN